MSKRWRSGKGRGKERRGEERGREGGGEERREVRRVKEGKHKQVHVVKISTKVNASR